MQIFAYDPTFTYYSNPMIILRPSSDRFESADQLFKSAVCQNRAVTTSLILVSQN